MLVALFYTENKIQKKMNQTSKPQIVPRTSLLKKKNSLENSLESEKNNNISDNNRIMIKPALPAKPVITTPSKKPSSSSNQQRQIPNDSSTIDSSTTATNHVINNNPPDKTKLSLKTKVEDIAQTSSSSLPSMGTKSTWKKSNRIKFRLTNVDLNRLRLRKDFDDKNIDPSGNSNNLIYDIREDDEQIRKMNEICELLVAGGYFRARIKGLHNFDKVCIFFICFDSIFEKI